MKPTAYGLSDSGLKRPQNEDFYLMDEELGLYVVCDGVGGNQAGSVASELCARTVRQVVAEGREFIIQYSKDKSLKNRAIIAGLLQKAVITANEKIYQMAEIDVTKKGMCTTMVAALSLEDYAVLAHVGDSRVYVYRGGQVHQLTEDHKYAVEMVKKGMFTPEEAARSPQGNILTRAVGILPTVQVDTLQLELMNGDMVLLCTDGLHNYATKNDLKTMFSHETTKITQELIGFAKQKGGADNVTALLIKIEDGKPAKEDVVDILKKTEILGKIPVFKYLSYPELTKVLSIAQVKQYKKGSPIVQEGGPSDEMFIIALGNVSVLKGGVKVAERSKGEVFGEMGIFDNAPRSATVQAEGDVSAISLHRKELLTLLRQDSSIAVKILWALNSELNARVRRATENVAQKLSQAGESLPEDTTVEIEILPFDHSQN